AGPPPAPPLSRFARRFRRAGAGRACRTDSPPLRGPAPPPAALRPAPVAPACAATTRSRRARPRRAACPRPPSGPPPPRLPAPRRPARAAAARAVDQLTQLVANRARGARPGSAPGPALGGDVGRDSPEAAGSTRPRPTRATVPGPERVAGV